MNSFTSAAGIVLLLSACLAFPAFAQHHSQVIVFVSDGMRQDFMKQFASEGRIPAYERLVDLGVDAGPGMIPPVPPNSGVAWTVLGTGASPSVSGVTGNSFHDNTQAFTPNGISAWTPGTNRTETVGAAADKAGLKVAVFGWQTFDKATIKNGIVIEPDPEWLTVRGTIANYDVPLQYTDIRDPLNPFLTLDKIRLEDARGWLHVPPSFSPARESAFVMRCIPGTPLPCSLKYDIYVFDTTNDGITNYDQVLVSSGKDGAGEVARLRKGEWSVSIPASVASDPSASAGKNGGFYLKVIDLESDLSKFRLYFTPVTRIQISQQNIEDYVVENFDSVAPDDFAPFVAGLIDAATYVEQSLRHAETLSKQIYPYVLRIHRPDLVLAGLGITDSIQHRMLAWAVPGNELYDPIDGAKYWRYIQQSYEASDSMLASIWAELPSANVFAASDHGMTVSGKAINANYVLEKIGLFNPSDLAASKAVAYGSGGVTMVHINLAGRNPDGVVAPEDFEDLRRQIVDAFNALGPSVVERVILKEEASRIETAGFKWNILHPNRTGDVLVFARPPYQYAAPVPGRVLSDLPFMAGQHGYPANGDPDRYAVFAAAGPNMSKGAKLDRPTALDLAPTIAFILGIKPANVEAAAAPYVIK